MHHKLQLALTLAASLSLAGCANSPLRSYDSEIQTTVAHIKSGSLDAALAHLENSNRSAFSSDSSKEDSSQKQSTETSNGRDILFYFEKGEVLNLQKEYERSRDTWLVADSIIRAWEDEFRTNPSKVMGQIGSFLVSDRTRDYDGQDYEKVFLSTKLTLTHILLGNFDHARIEMKKTYEREKLIESFREKEYDKLQEEGKKQGVEVNTNILTENGYPMDELDSPEVNQLKNGFQNAFAHYLAGFFFEATGEYSLAEPGYRNALALRPNSTLIKERVGKAGRNKPGPGQADVLFVVETGFAPAWKSVTIPIPIPINKRVVVTPLSFPVIRPVGTSFMPKSLKAGNKKLTVETLVNVDAMARRLLKDQLPGIVGRTMIRAIAKTALQYQAQKKGGAVAGLLTTVATVVTEQADERAWRTLPERVAVARAILPQGKMSLEFETGSGTHTAEVTISGRLTVIPIRLANGTVYVGQPVVEAAMSQSMNEQSNSASGKPSKRPRTKKKPATGN
ncbi:MAG: COG3014 family protein [Azovibrio sp.]